MTRHLVFLASAFALTACSNEPSVQPAEETSPDALQESVSLIGRDGVTLGSVSISEDANGTTLALVVESGLQEGMHGVHLHETGSCVTPDFTSAGGHWNPESKAHGRDNPEGAHVGDLANLSIGPDGSGRSTFLIENVLLKGGLHSMADEDGTALVIHAGPDDYVTDPSGDSGAREACAVIAAAD